MDTSRVGESSRMLEQAIDVLRKRLPDSWIAEFLTEEQTGESTLVVTSPSKATSFLVEVLGEARPREVKRLFATPAHRRLRREGALPVLVVAPLLSAQTRALLRSEGVNYLDTCGNILLRADCSGLLIEVEPLLPKGRRTPSSVRGLAGASAGRVMRVLIDGQPPATLDAVARAAQISLGYCSRVAKVLSDEMLVDRSPSGGIASSDWITMVRRRGEVSELFRPQITTQWVARGGVERCLELLAASPPEGLWCVTGSHAAARHAPVTAPRGLTLWALPLQITAIARDLDLLRVDEGGDVRLLAAPNFTPFDRVGDDQGDWWQRPPEAPLQGVRWAAPSQAAIDCLAGTGRMPEEGAALLEWMATREAQWRRTSIADLPYATAPSLEPL